MAEFKHIVRVANTDIDGDKQVLIAMQKIKGVGIMYANMALAVAGVDKAKKAGDLLDSEVQKIDEVLNSPKKYDVPTWLLNRRKDFETGEDRHLLNADLTFETDNDTKRMKKTKSYKGLRHQWKLPVRGQRTQSNFRRNKGKGLAVKKKTTIRK